MNQERPGVVAAVGAFFLWGVLPLFWKLMDFLPPTSIVAQRTLWSLLILLFILAWQRDGGAVLTVMRRPKLAGWHFLSGLLLAANWLLYVWATLNHHIIEGALGYYLNPFFNMLFGILWFGERHNRFQILAISVALCGVAVQIPTVGHFPWIALTLAITFSLYGVVKKRAPLDSRLGLTLETILLAPVALGWLMMNSTDAAAAFGGTWAHALIVIASGFATTLPLVLFGFAARRIRLTTLGILQFIGPTLQLLIGWKVFGEALTPARVLSFTLIWTAIAIYAADSMTRQPRNAAAGD